MGRQPVLQDYGNIQNPPGDLSAASDNARLSESRRQHIAQMGQHRAEQKQKGQEDAIDYVNKLDVPDIGDNTIDLYNNDQLKATQDELMDMIKKGAGVNEIKMVALPKLQKIAQGYTIAKNEYGKLAEGVKELSKDNPTGDMAMVRNIGGKELLKTIFDFDENGKVKEYKDPSLITADKNYLENLNTNENLPKWYKESGAFEKGIKDLPLIPINTEITDKDKYGNKVKKVYTGHGSVFDEPVMNADGKQVGIKLKSESVSLGRNPDGSLNIIEVMPKEQFDLAIPNDKARKDFDLRLNKKLEESGINPDEIDPRAKDLLEREFALDFFRKTNIHGSLVSEKEINEAAPVKSSFNVRVNNGSGKPAVPVMDIVTPVRSYFENVGEQKEGLKGVAQLNLFNNEVTTPVMNEVKVRYPDITADDIYYQKSGNDIWVMKADETGKVNKQKDVPVFKLDDFTNVSGNKPQGVKSKNEALRQAQSGKTATKTAAPKKEIKRSDIAGKAAAAGYSVKEYEALLKQKGVSIKD